MRNYDCRDVGVPYVRVSKVVINYPSAGIAHVQLDEESAVKLKDGAFLALSPLGALSDTIDLAVKGMDVMPLVDVDSGLPLDPVICQQLGAMVAAGAVNMNFVMLTLLAAIRAQQMTAYPQG